MQYPNTGISHLQGLTSPGSGLLGAYQGQIQQSPYIDHYHTLWCQTAEQLKRAHELIGQQQMEIERLRNTKEWLTGDGSTPK